MNGEPEGTADHETTIGADGFFSYPAVYRDVEGEEHVTLRSSGRTLQLTVRGLTYLGDSFDDLCTQPELEEESSCLYGYSLEYTMSVPLIADGQPQRGSLRVHVAIDGAYRDPLGVRLELRHWDSVVAAEGEEFEDTLIRLQKQLPEGSSVQCCFTCAFSDYWPYGHQLFGDLGCFRDNRGEYLAAETTDEIFGVWRTVTEMAQETHLCPEYERRRPGTGYRG